MQNLFVASTVALLASSASAAIPKKSEYHVKQLRTTALKEHKTRVKTEGAEAVAVSSKQMAKDEGLVSTESHGYSMFFEIRMGSTDCSTTTAKVSGLEMNRCMDTIYDDDMSGAGQAMSEMMVMPNNGGFPIMLFYYGHGCRDDNMIFSYRLPKTDMGFPPHYSTGACNAVMAPDGTTVMYHMGAMWNSMRYEPTMAAVMYGGDGRDKGCQRGKFYYYEGQMADLCMDETDDDDNVLYNFKFDLTNCGAGSFIELRYSPTDTDCSGTVVDTVQHKSDECVFDYVRFADEMANYNSAYFEYQSSSCFVPSAP